MDKDEKDIIAVIEQIDEWKGCHYEYRRVPGGKTNPNWEVTIEDKTYFVKIPGVGTEVFIDRKNCHQANLIAQNTGIGPTVFQFFEETGVEIFEWITGCETVKFGDVFDAEKFYKMIDVAKQFHSYKDIKLPLVQTAFDQTEEMLRIAKELKGHIPAEMDRMEWLVESIKDAITTAGIDYVPCHNDFWSANFVWIEETRKIMLLDFEYASMNDECYDLGIWSAVNYFTEAMELELIRYYYGRHDEQKFAKLKLYKILQDIKWAMWSCVQAVNSPVKEYDYFEWLGAKMARLRSFWNDPRIDYWFNLLKGKTIF